MTDWSIEQIPDQHGRTVVITGANSGIGFEAAKALAGRGARVVLAVRNRERGDQAAARIGGRAEVAELDLSELASIRAFAAGWSGPIEVLINNAGLMAVPFGRTADGFELQFGTNHLGHFALTNLLLDRIGDRVVTVSSGSHRMGGLDLSDPNFQRRPYKRWAAYGQSKLANLLFTLELQRRLTESGSAVRALAAHPGFAATNLQGHSGNPRIDKVSMALTRLIAQPAAHGARPTVFAATADLPGGSYVGPAGRGEARGRPTLAGRSPQASNPDLARQLWTRSEDLTGVRFPASLDHR